MDKSIIDQRYVDLNNKLEEKHPVNINGEDVVLEYSGKGGWKKAWKYTDELVILTPNYDNITKQNPGEEWNHLIKDEIEGSKYLNSLGLMNPNNFEIFVDNLSTIASTNFFYLAEKRIYIIELKSVRGNTYRNDKYLMNYLEEWRHKIMPPRVSSNSLGVLRTKINENTLMSILEPLMNDIIVLLEHNQPLGGDSFNIAIVKENDNYHVRYFGFDFSHLSGFSSQNQRQNISFSDGRTRNKFQSVVGDVAYFIRFFSKVLEKIEDKYIQKLNIASETILFHDIVWTICNKFMDSYEYQKIIPNINWKKKQLLWYWIDKLKKNNGEILFGSVDELGIIHINTSLEEFRQKYKLHIRGYLGETMIIYQNGSKGNVFIVNIS